MTLIQAKLQLINSRMLEIYDWTSDFNIEFRSISPESNICERCQNKLIITYDCHLCGLHLCKRCVGFFLLPEKFYIIKTKSPLSVCWACHDICISRALRNRNIFDSIRTRNRINIVKKSNFDNKMRTILVFNPPKSYASLKYALCFSCDSDKIYNNCNLCGEVFCSNCSYNIPLLPKEYRKSKTEKMSRICNECAFKCHGSFRIGNNNKKLVLNRKSEFNNLHSLIDQKQEKYKYEIENYVEKTMIVDKKKELIDMKECYICKSKSSPKNILCICILCKNAVCKKEYKNFFMPKDTYESDSYSLDYAQCVCMKCHKICMDVKSILNPKLKPTRYRKNRVIKKIGTKSIIYHPLERPSSSTSVKTCFFCLKAVSNGSVCKICNELFCDEDILNIPLFNHLGNDVKNKKNICFECRYLMIGEKYEVCLNKIQVNQSFTKNTTELTVPSQNEIPDLYFVELTERPFKIRLNQNSMRITNVEKDSIAWKKGIRKTHCVLFVNGIKANIKSVKDNLPIYMAITKKKIRNKFKVMNVLIDKFPLGFEIETNTNKVMNMKEDCYANKNGIDNGDVILFKKKMTSEEYPVTLYVLKINDKSLNLSKDVLSDISDRDEDLFDLSQEKLDINERSVSVSNKKTLEFEEDNDFIEQLSNDEVEDDDNKNNYVSKQNNHEDFEILDDDKILDNSNVLNEGFDMELNEDSKNENEENSSTINHSRKEELNITINKFPIGFEINPTNMEITKVLDDNLSNVYDLKIGDKIILVNGETASYELIIEDNLPFEITIKREM